MALAFFVERVEVDLVGGRGRGLGQASDRPVESRGQPLTLRVVVDVTADAMPCFFSSASMSATSSSPAMAVFPERGEEVTAPGTVVDL